MTSPQNAKEHVKDQFQQGNLTAAEANVRLIQIAGIRVVSGKMPADLRKVLNDAVKRGDLGRVKKDGLKPEVYHHKNARPRAIEEQNRIAREKADSLKGLFS